MSTSSVSVSSEVSISTVAQNQNQNHNQNGILKTKESQSFTLFFPMNTVAPNVANIDLNVKLIFESNYLDYGESLWKSVV